METTDKATAIREARQTLRARGEPDSMNRVVAIVRSSKRTVQKYWAETAPEPAPTASAPTPVPGLVPAPEPPAFDLATLRAYFRSGAPAPWGSGALWPDGGRPPLAAYGLLTTLSQEADALVVKGWQAWMQAKNEAGTRRGTHDDASVSQAEERWSTERLLQSRLKDEIDNMQQRAHYEGKTLTT